MAIRGASTQTYRTTVRIPAPELGVREDRLVLAEAGEHLHRRTEDPADPARRQEALVYSKANGEEEKKDKRRIKGTEEPHPGNQGPVRAGDCRRPVPGLVAVTVVIR